MKGPDQTPHPPKNLLLISANTIRSPYPVYPTGLAYIAARTRRELPHYRIRVFDMNLGTFEELAERISSLKPDYIGISIRNIDDANSKTSALFLPHYKKLFKAVKELADCPIILGGAAYSIYPKALFEELSPDFAIAGEGEEAFVKLLSALESNHSYEDIGGLVYRSDEGQVLQNPPSEFVRDPSPEYEQEIIDYYWQQGGMIGIQTKRGCPHKCIYCTYPVIEGTATRALDPDTIVDRMRRLKEEKGVDYFYFTDSTFNIDRDLNRKLAKAMLNSKINVRWGAFFAPTSTLTKEDLQLYKESGLEHVEFGTESLSDTVLKSYAKPFRVKDVIHAAELCRDLDLYTAHYLILGGYGETPDTLEETLLNSERLTHTVFFPFIGMRIYPGTPLQEIAVREGRIDEDDDLLEPKFYIASGMDFSDLKQRVSKHKNKWILPDEDCSHILQALRRKGRKGPLWEKLIV